MNKLQNAEVCVRLLRRDDAELSGQGCTPRCWSPPPADLDGILRAGDAARVAEFWDASFAEGEAEVEAEGEGAADGAGIEGKGGGRSPSPSVGAAAGDGGGGPEDVAMATAANEGHSRVLTDCLIIGTLAMLVALFAARRANRFERASFVNYFIARLKVSDQRELLRGGRIEVLALFSNPDLRRLGGRALLGGLGPLKLGREIKSLLTSVPAVYTAIEPAASLAEAAQALRQHDPQLALFSGHSFMGRLAFELPSGSLDLPPPAEVIAVLQPDGGIRRLRCVFLNGCFTFDLGVQIVRQLRHLQVVCWSSLAEDAAARAFAHGFHDAIGSSLVASEPVDVEHAYSAGLSSFVDAGYLYGDPAAYLHPPNHPHARKPVFGTCLGCSPPVHGRPVLLWSENGELYIREESSSYPLTLVPTAGEQGASEKEACSACNGEQGTSEKA